jgi:hypothetical protein
MTDLPTLLKRVDLHELRERVERLRKLAHEAPMNPYRLDHDGHRWVEPISRAWADRAREYCEALAILKAELSHSPTGERTG